MEIKSAKFDYVVGTGKNLALVNYFIPAGKWQLQVVHENGTVLHEESGESAIDVVGVWNAASIPGKIKMDQDPETGKWYLVNGGLVIRCWPAESK